MSRRPYDSQYQDPYDPWPSGRRNWIVWLIFFMPGSLQVWYEYMFPEKGQVWASRRRAENRIIIVAYSIVFWLTLFTLGFIFYRLTVVRPVQTVPTFRSYKTIEGPKASDKVDLGKTIVSGYGDCWRQYKIQLPEGYIPVVRIFFDNNGQITRFPILEPSSDGALRSYGLEILQMVQNCRVNIPENLRYLSRQWGQRAIRFDPSSFPQ